MINEVISVCKLSLVNPGTSASGERSFSTTRRLKTWLRSTMTLERFSNLTILNSHKERTERLSLVDIVNEFADRNDNRKRNFGILRNLIHSKYQPLPQFFFFCFVFILIDAPFIQFLVYFRVGVSK